MLQTTLHNKGRVHIHGGNLLHQPLQEEALGSPVRTGLVILLMLRLQEGGKRLLSRVFHIN